MLLNPWSFRIFQLVNHQLLELIGRNLFRRCYRQEKLSIGSLEFNHPLSSAENHLIYHGQITRSWLTHNRELSSR